VIAYLSKLKERPTQIRNPDQIDNNTDNK